MCGIVLAGCADTLSQTEVALFEKLVYHDTIRGSHSTGVFAGYNFNDISKEQYVIYGKTAQTGPDFLESKTWASVKTQEYVTAHKATAKRSPYFLVGHNRYATMGAKTSQNAHPFVSGDVTLVHNGTLTNQSLLPDHKQFEVDSANICHAINKQGIEETLKQLDGAFTLVWYDDRDKTVNIIRNEERPFHLARTNLDTWYGASEEEMLMWLLKREDKYSLYRTSPTIAEHFECEVGVQYIFDVSNGNFDLVEQVKHELPTFAPTYSGYGGYSGYDFGSYYDRKEVNNFSGKGKSGSAPAKTNVLVKKTDETAKNLFKEVGLHDMEIGDSLWFLSTKFEIYPSNTGRGRLEGILDKQGANAKIMCHAFYEDDYEQDIYFRGEIVGIYKSNGVIHIIVKEAESCPTGGVEELIVTEDAQIYSEADWNDGVRSTCLSCLTAIPFNEAEDATARDGRYVCRQCSEDEQMYKLDRGFVEEEEDEEDAPFLNAKFHCHHCGEMCDTHTETSPHVGMCTTCYYAFLEFDKELEEVPAITKELDNGAVVTEAQWKEINTCSCCGSKVSFQNAEFCLIENNKLTCINCYL